MRDDSRDTQDFRKHFRVVIPLAEIASARRFDPDAYEQLRRANPRDDGQPSAKSVT